MDLMGLAGIVLGILAVVLGNLAEGGLTSALINGPAAVIVFGGTLAAVMVQTPANILAQAFRRAFWLVFPPRYELEDLLETLCQWAQAARKEGLMGLENIADVEPSLFARKGLNLLADGQPPDAIRNSLELDMYKKEDQGLQSAHV